MFFGSSQAVLQYDGSVDINLCLRMKLLHDVINKPYAYKDIIEGGDKKCLLNQFDICNIRFKSMYLYNAYKNALATMNKSTWEDCCRNAIVNLSNAGINYISHYRTVQRWNLQFRSQGYFPNHRESKINEPPLFELFPEIKHKMINFCHQNLIDMSIKRVHQELVKKIIPYQIAKEGITADEEAIVIRQKNESPNEAAVTSDDDVIGAIMEDETTINSQEETQHPKPFRRKYNRSN